MTRNVTSHVTWVINRPEQMGLAPHTHSSGVPVEGTTGASNRCLRRRHMYVKVYRLQYGKPTWYLVHGQAKIHTCTISCPKQRPPPSLSNEVVQTQNGDPPYSSLRKQQYHPNYRNSYVGCGLGLGTGFSRGKHCGSYDLTCRSSQGRCRKSFTSAYLHASHPNCCGKGLHSRTILCGSCYI